jgi:hypothetical protein
MTAIPTDPEGRERWRRDPEAYEAVERLHDAHEVLVESLYEHLYAIGVLFDVMHEPARSYFRAKGTTATQERLEEARQQVCRARGRWAAVVSQAEALLVDRQEGGDA